MKICESCSGGGYKAHCTLYTCSTFTLTHTHKQKYPDSVYRLLSGHFKTQCITASSTNRTVLFPYSARIEVFSEDIKQQFGEEVTHHLANLCSHFPFAFIKRLFKVFFWLKIVKNDLIWHDFDLIKDDDDEGCHKYYYLEPITGDNHGDGSFFCML